MQNLIITRAGEELAARLVSGACSAEFTRLVASDHDYSSDVISELSELSDVRQSVLIPSVRRIDGTVIEIMAAMDNRDLSAGYYVRAIGVFAREAGGEEVLFAVSIEPDLPFYLPPFSGKTVSSVTYRLDVKVSNSDNVVFEANPAAYVTVEQLGDLETLADEHLRASVSSADGAHGVRYFNGEFRVLDGNGIWVGIDAITLNGKSSSDFAAVSHSHSASQISGLPTSLPASGGNADTVGGAEVMATAALGLHRMASGTAVAATDNCPVGCWYGQYE